LGDRALFESLVPLLFCYFSDKIEIDTAMNDQVEESKAKAAIKLGILIGIIALIELICGFIYLSKGGIDGSGLWSGAGVNNCRFVLTFFSLSTVRSEN